MTTTVNRTKFHENGLGQSDTVSFGINGKQYDVNVSNSSLGPDARLVDYIRDEAGLKGTKWSCREGGCGACVVTVRTKDPKSGEEVVRAVNSCLAPVLACDGWDISTVEDIGNRRDGFHPVQKRLADFGGTQCGFCSPGMVMNMYSLTQSKKKLTSQDVEDNFDGNICRCTGYRPIMDAFKSFTVDADPALKKRTQDIEDFLKDCPGINGHGKGANGHTNGTNGHANGANCVHNGEDNSSDSKCAKKQNGTCCQSNGGGCSRTPISLPSKNLDLYLPSGKKWNKVTDLETVFDIVKNHAKNNLTYRIVAGNTGTGVFKNDGPYDAYVEVNSISALTVTSVNKLEAVMGAGLTLTKTIDFLEDLAKKSGFEYAAGMSKHIKRVANTPIRNFGTIAGNLMMKHDHHDFPSDIFLILETVGAKVHVASSPIDISAHNPVEFLNVDMTGKLVVYITLPKLEGGYIFRSFKITKRHQNAHAYVNAGFLLKIDPSQHFKVLEKPSITFGGINPGFVHATKTEEVLTGAELGDVNTLQKALEALEGEVQPDHHLPDATPKYRKSLTQNLLYKVVLGIVGSEVASTLRSGADDLPRKLQSGKQVCDTDAEFKDSPLYKPVPKIEGPLQCSGEAQYVNDIPKQSGELFGAFVLTTVANCTLKNVDASVALKVPGVVTFVTAKDIPGKNSFYDGIFGPCQEEIFVEDKVLCSGQAVGLIVAENQEIANAAAKLVKVDYKDPQKPMVKAKEVWEKMKQENNADKAYLPFVIKTADEPNTASKHVIKGEFLMGGQAHIHLENHVSLVIPKEDGYTVYSATQWIAGIQEMIAKVLNIPNNTIDVEVRRLGGGYGGKITRPPMLAVSAALASSITRKPVRIALDLETGMEMFGKRTPYCFDYEVGFDDNGKIDSLQIKIISDTGMKTIDPDSPFAAMFLQNCYKALGWHIQPGTVLTDTHSNTACRAPGTTNGIAAIENIMEHIADVLKKDPMEVRQVNYLQTGDALLPLPEMPTTLEGTNMVPSIVTEMKSISDYESRKQFVEEFNRTNRWRKRGLAMVPMRYPQGYHGLRYSSYVAIHNQDGSVVVSHGGIEMGQGINTKVAQVAAHELGIPLNKVVVKPSNNLVGANSICSGGAITSELVVFVTQKACKQLLERMQPIKKGLENPSWEELVQKSHVAGVDLRSTFMVGPEDNLKSYEIYACNLTEVEVDILTGEYKIVRLDLIEDAGKSLSPDVDLGQIEGALVMGLGLWTEERLVFDPDTGRLLTRNTWEYKVPFPKSIPEDLRITIMRKSENPLGILRSKATGEPPLCTAVTVLFAIKNAIKAARKDAGNTDWFQLDGPVTPEDVVRLSLTNPTSHFTY